MRFVSFSAEGRSSYGLVTDRGVFDLGRRIGALVPDLKSYLVARALGLGTLPAVTGADYKLDEIRYEPVIKSPGKIICVGLNYEAHRQETGRPKSDYPSLFPRFPETLLGHRGTILRPRVSTQLDYEAELALVIGRSGRRVPRAKALDLVAGYSCFNDATVRDWQRHTPQWLPGKNFPTTGPFGPELVTPDELGRFEDTKIEGRLNGETMQSATLGDMIFTVPQLIEYISTFTPLAPGDVIVTGTLGGVGFKREPPVFMKAGDRFEVAIERVGLLSNDVQDEPEAG
jgi:2-keto-4-pentenoate hydratase/2-oxohepta-3-ene-1,7-dioic acid hydratase in catechol pathway